MSTETEKVLATKQTLMASLGDDTWMKYLGYMKLWFRQRYSKNEFDMACRKLLTPNQVRLHNQFLLAILNKVDILEPPSVKSEHQDCVSQIPKSLSKKRRRAADNATFDPAFIMEYIPYEDHVDHTPPTATQPSTIRYAAQEMFLPDTGLVMGRLLIAAWETGLVSADENAVDLILTGVQNLLKNILTAIITQRKHCKTTADTKYFYDVGTPLKNPFIRNTVTRQKIDDDPLDIDKEISSMSMQRRVNEETQFLAACEEPPYHVSRKRITKLDLYTALKDRNLIPSHSVYAVNIEKISNMLT